MITVPNLSPDELSRGYIGKLKRANGDSAMAALRKRINRALPEFANDPAKCNWTHLLAQLSGVGMERFICDHSLMPFLRAVHGQFAGIAHGTSSTPAQLMLVGTALSGKTAHLCKDCIREDLSYWGVAYWRRTHQLSGCVLCQKHGSSLWQVDGDLVAEGLPSDFESQARPIDEDLVHQASQNPVIQRYVEICNAFLESRHPVHPEHAAACLYARANQHGLRVSTIGTRANLSDYVIATVPARWRDEFFDCLKNKQKRAFVAKIDGTCVSKHVSYQASSYALALAALWDSSQDALTEFYRQPSHAEPKPDSTICHAASHFGDPMDVPSISSKIVSRRDVEFAVESFVAGLSLGDACKKHDVDPRDLEDLLRIVVSRH